MSELKKSYFAGSMTAVRIDVLLFTCCILLAITGQSSGETMCRYSKQKSYVALDCADRKFDRVPNNLQSDTEVLDLSNNKIRVLQNDSFSCCTSIKFLYLQDNSIYDVDSHAFYPLGGLEVLDLSVNVLSEIPKNLPTTLRKLFLDNIPLLFRNDVSHPQLKIAYLTSLLTLTLSTNKLTAFPIFDDHIPNLLELNITHNNIEIITPEHLAPLCQLKYLYVSAEKMFPKSEQSCDCLKFDWWIRKYDITLVKPITCKKDKNVKCVVEPKNTTLAIRDKCLEEYNSRKLPHKLMMGSCIVAVILCLGILLYIRYRRKKRQKSKTATPNQNSRTPSVKFGKALEDNNERAPVEEDKLLKQ